METLDVDITDINKVNDLELYENLQLSPAKPAATTSSLKYEEEHYEALQFKDTKEPEPKVETDTKEKTVNGLRLKLVIYFNLVLISILYVAFIVLVIILFALRNPVDGQWAEWSSWTSCDVTCGNGTILRTRTCTNPVPIDKGTDCVGDSLQSSLCFNDNCPVDGQWTYWSSWTSCDVTCGKGSHLRTRRCSNPIPANNGKDCDGESLQNRQCSKEKCPVDGQWAYWSSWTSCDVTCGKGSHLRTRRCSNPFPANNGKDCNGESLQSRPCSKEKCPAFMSAFSVQKPHFYGVINGRSKMNFTNTIYQYGSDFNISSGTFTCTIPGVYHFSATLVKKRASTRVDQVYCYMYKNSQYLIYIKIDPTDDETDKGSAAVSQSIVIDLKIGDTVYLGSCISQPAKYMESWSSFTGFLLYYIG